MANKLPVDNKRGSLEIIAKGKRLFDGSIQVPYAFISNLKVQPNSKARIGLIDYTQFYFKFADTSPESSYLPISSFIGAGIFSKLGIPSPMPDMVSYTYQDNRPLIPYLSKPSGYLITSQDAAHFEGFDCTVARDMELFKNNLIKNITTTTDKWAIVKDENLRKLFLTFMTEECLEELITIFLTTEILGNKDMNLGNYIFYKKEGSTLFEGVCPIDQEQNAVAEEFFSRKHNIRISTHEAMREPYESFTPTNTQDRASYVDRMKQIHQLIKDGLLSEKNLIAIETVLSCNTPHMVEQINTKYKAIANKDFVQVMSDMMTCAQSIIGPSLQTAKQTDNYTM